MKIMLVPSWYMTEDKPMNGIFFKEQARALEAAGHEVCILYPDLRFKLGRLRKGLFRASESPLTYICRRRTFTPFIERGRWPQRCLMLEKLYKAALRDWGRPDVIHLHSCRMGVETLWLCRRHSLPLVYTEHFTGVRAGMAPALEYALKKTLSGCDRAIAVSEALRSIMLPYRADILYIPNLIDTSRFKIIDGAGGQAGFVFGAMGSLIPRKGFDTLIRAFAAASGDMPGASLVIAGEGAMRESLLTLAAELHVAERVSLCGPVERERAPAFFNSCSCLVCASLSETFGMTLIEALACGRPVISTRCGGPQSIVTSDNGVLVEPGDALKMADALRYFYSNIGRFSPERLREDCTRNFGAQAVEARLTEVYRSVLAGYGR